MMITTNTIILFQMFIDPDPIEHKYLEDIRIECATYFIEKKNKFGFRKIPFLIVKYLFQNSKKERI